MRKHSKKEAEYGVQKLASLFEFQKSPSPILPLFEILYNMTEAKGRVQSAKTMQSFTHMKNEVWIGQLYDLCKLHSCCFQQVANFTYFLFRDIKFEQLNLKQRMFTPIAQFYFCCCDIIAWQKGTQMIRVFGLGLQVVIHYYCTVKSGT